MNTGKLWKRTGILMLLTTIALLTTGNGLASARTGIECGCTKTGDYKTPATPKKPAAGKAPAVTAVAGYDNVGTSSKGKYQSTISTTGVLNVVEVASGTTVLNLTGVMTGNWGFSPDEDRFLWWWTDQSGFHVRLYDLTDGRTATAVWSYDGPVGSAQLLFSPHGKYLLLAALTGSNQLSLKAVDVSSGSVAHSADLAFSPLAGALEKSKPTDPEGVSWGFSPDSGDTMLTYAWVQTGGSSARRRLIVLATDRTVLDDTITEPQMRLRFSPKAKHLITSSVNADHAYLTVSDADTGAIEYTDDFTFTNPPAETEDKFSGAAWGFGPDSKDVSLLYAWNTASGTKLRVADLSAGSLAVDTIVSGGAMWRFSPCGDLLAVDAQSSASQMIVSLFRTVDGTSLELGANAVFPVVTINFTATDTEHQAITAGATQAVTTVLTPNTAGADCPVPDTESPAWPAGSELTADNVSETGLSLSWSPATDNVGVTGYRIFRDGQQLAAVDGSTTTYAVSGLTSLTTYGFTVQAGDAAGNWSTDGPATSVKTAGDTGPPTWPAGSSLYAADQETSVWLNWTAAEDDTGVTSYRIYRDGSLVATVPDTYYEITGLAIGTTLSLRVEAGDAAGNWSTGGPTAQVTTTDQSPPDWNGGRMTASDFLPDATGLTLSWPAAQDNVGVAAYEVYRYDPNTTNPDWDGGGEMTGPGGWVGLGHLDGNSTSLAVTGLVPGEVYDFMVRAGDTAGNWTWNGPELSVNTDAYPPAWPSGSAVTVSGLGTSRATVTWTPAKDNVAVEAYYVYVDGINIARVPAAMLRFDIHCLLPQSTHAVTIQAADRSRQVSTDGPLLSFTTLAGSPPPALSTVLASVSSSGEQGNADSGNAMLSGDGRHVAFNSGASNLVANDNNGVYDVFVRDLDTGTTELVSVSSTGEPGNENSNAIAISADGNYVLFTSFAKALVPDDTNRCFPWSDWDGRCPDVFLRNRRAGTTERVNLSSSGGQAENGDSLGLDMSPDARFILFRSAASNLVSGDYNSKMDVFLRDRQDNTTELVSISTSGSQGNGYSRYGAVSDDGRFVAFDSMATNLDDDQPAPYGGIYLRDRQSGTTRLLVANESTASGYADYERPDISGDGRYVVFHMNSDTGWQVELYDANTDEIKTISLKPDGTPATGSQPSISADGRYVAFGSYADDLLPEDSNGQGDIFVYDRISGITSRASVCSDGSQVGGSSYWPEISDSGRYVAFQSDAADLIPLPGDANKAADVFVHDRQPTGNRPPVIAVSGPLSGEEGKTMRLILTAADPDGDALTLAAENLPAEASFTDQGDGSAIFSWTPAEGQAGSYSITFRASDGALTDALRIFIEVTTAPPPPTPGDADGNGQVDVADVMAVLRMVVGGGNVDLSSCDVAPLRNDQPSPDGRCDLADALEILRRTAELTNW